MFAYQLVKRFPSPGYEVWEDWREHYLSTGMKLGWTEEEMMKWLPKKLCGWALNAVSDLPRGYWRSIPVKQAWTLTENLYQFDIRLSDNPNFYERSYNLFVRGKAGNKTEFSKINDTADQRTRQQSSHLQSPESGEISDEQSDDDYLFKDISDTDFSDVKEFGDNDSRSETSIAGSLDSEGKGAGGAGSDFAQLGKELEVWVQSPLRESQLISSVSVEPTDEHQGDSAGVDRTGKSDQKSMAKVFHSWVYDEQQPRREDSSGFSMEVEQTVERRFASRFPEIAKLLLENVKPEREVEPLERIETAVMAGLQ